MTRAEAESVGSVARSVGAVADLDEGALWLAPLILAGALVVGLITAILVIAGAPALLSEVLAAAVAQHLIPTADSIGDFFRQG